jgi:hypothetical protein
MNSLYRNVREKNVLEDIICSLFAGEKLKKSYIKKKSYTIICSVLL